MAWQDRAGMCAGVLVNSFSPFPPRRLTVRRFSRASSNRGRDAVLLRGGWEFGSPNSGTKSVTPLDTQTGHWPYSQTSSGYQRPLLPLEGKFYQDGVIKKHRFCFCAEIQTSRESRTGSCVSNVTLFH